LLVEQKIADFLREDVHFEDVTSALIPADEAGSAIIIAKEDGFICGLAEIEILYELLGCKMEAKKQDGDPVEKGETVASVTGPIRALLQGERTALNLLMHLSGVATKTREFQAIVERERVNTRCKIAATRKTIPGLRVMEKRAVKIAGGDTHRWDLDDMVLLKDTHRSYFGDVSGMVTKYKAETSFTKKIEVEVETIDDALQAAQAGADIILLDNMAFDDMKDAVASIEAAGLRGSVIIESSGNVDVSSLPDHARTGVDLISTSAITLKARAIDFSQELVR
jgi:nicotinate-nucleotide pyrophosphorylase (carboxylating)